MFEENEISIKANGGTELAKRSIGELIDPELAKHFQVVSSRVRELDPTKIRIFYAHDLPEDPESAKFRDQQFQDSFHQFVFISNWQYQRYQLVHGIKQDMKSAVIEHGITPASIDVLEKKVEDKIRLVYTSTPQRGLEILVPVFQKLAEKYDNIHLDVFSSFKIYGWEDADKQFEPLYEQIRNHPQMTYHGFVSNEELRKHLETAHIHAYPSIWLETACRAVIEAMSAGLVCVHPNLAALPDTTGSLNVMYQCDLENKNLHANVFASYLNAAIRMVQADDHREIISLNKVFVDRRYHLNMISAKWDQLLRQLLEQYPTEESRAIAKETFVYKTS